MKPSYRREVIRGLGIGLGMGALLVLVLALVACPLQLLGSPPSDLLSPTPEVGSPVASSPTLTPLPPWTPPTSEVSGRTTYTVLEGDTLFGIAYRFGITVEALKAANDLQGDLIYPGQVLDIPPWDATFPTPTPLIGTPGTAVWRPSLLEGDLGSAYAAILEMERFTLHYTPGTYPAQDPQAVADMVLRGLEHIEAVLSAHLEGRFDVYVAGSLFAPPDQALRGRSFSAARRYFFLHDGTGGPADQQYIATHELTHLFTWNTFGRPVSAMLSEGVAVHTGMTQIAESEHVPPDVFCAAYHRAGRLPRVSANLSFQGHIRDLENYYAAGCFVTYLIETYGPQRFGRLYPTGDYEGVYGQTLSALEEEWIAHLEVAGPSVPFDPDDLIRSVESVGTAYDELFAIFTGTPAQMAAYLELDAARIALLEGRLEEVNQHLSAFHQQLGP